MFLGCTGLTATSWVYVFCRHHSELRNILGLHLLSHIAKVQLFWEFHKNLHNLPHGFDIYLVNIKTMRFKISGQPCGNSTSYVYFATYRKGLIISNSWILTSASFHLIFASSLCFVTTVWHFYELLAPLDNNQTQKNRKIRK